MVSQELARPLTAPRQPRPAQPQNPNRPDSPSRTAGRDRRAGVERAIELSRWIVLIFAAVSNNFPGVSVGPRHSLINLVLGGWAVFNLTATLMLLAGRLPGRHIQLAMTALDITVAGALVYLSGGFQSELGVAFYLVIIAGSLRFRVIAKIICTIVSAAAYFIVGFIVANFQLTGPLIG